MSGLLASLPPAVASAGPRPVALSLVIPAFNEEAVILQALREAVTSLTAIVRDFEIVVVDDGSRDQTARLVTEFAAQEPRVRLLQQPRNMGYGAALRTGFQAATKELVAFTDADCQFHIDDLGYLIDLADRFDIVSGYRIDRKDSSLRRFCSWGYNTLVQTLMGSPVRDIDCALKVFRREALLQILPQTNAFFANTEMFSQATELGLRIVDVGVRHRARAAGTSKVRFTDVPRTLDALLPYWWKMHFAGQRPTAQTEPHSLWTWIAGALVLLVSACMLMTNLDYPLIEPDEGRYAEIMREMAVTGDWLVPRLYQESYLDKPPLFYWCGALCIQLFGPHDWAVRTVPAVCAWLTVLATFLLGRKLLGTRSALLAMLILALSIGFSLCGRYLILDSMLTLFVTTSLLAGAVAACEPGRWSWRMWLLSALCCSLGTLTKGPVAILLVVPPLVAHAWLQRNQFMLRLAPWTAFIGVILLVNLPWYIAMALTVPNFVTYFFWEHNIARFLTGSNHPAPVWFYLPVLVLGWMPWGGLLFPLMPFMASRSRKRRVQRSSQLGLLGLGAVWCLAFFSISSGKLPTYIVPCFPWLALLMGHYLECTRSPFSMEWIHKVKVHSLYYKAGVGVCLSGVVFPYVLWRLKLETVEVALMHSFLWAGIACVVMTWQRRSAASLMWWSYCVLAMFATLEASHRLFPAWAQQNALLQPASKLQEEMETPSVRVACVQHAPGSVPFYLNRNDIARLTWDQPQELQDFVSDSSRIYLVVDEHVDLNQLKSQLPVPRELEVLATGTRGKIVRLQEPQVPERVQVASLSNE